MGLGTLARVIDVEYSFDPFCPWTWLTSRWLVDAAAQRDVRVAWRPLSLLVLSGGQMPEEYLGGVTASHRVLRVVAALYADGRHDDAGRYYAAIGRLTHDAGERLTDALADRALTEAGLDDLAPVLDDTTWDAAVDTATKEAVDLAGPDVGSPVMSWSATVGSGPDAPTQRVAFHGPIVSPGPRGEDAARLLDAVLLAGATPGFFELKRGRDAPPSLPSPPLG